MSAKKKKSQEHRVFLLDEDIASSKCYAQRSDWNSLYNRSQTFLTETDLEISYGLSQRLAYYARARVSETGWGNAVHGSQVHVYTCDAPDVPSKAYCVDFLNEHGSSISVDGILTNKGWPILDHGISLNEAPISEYLEEE